MPLSESSLQVSMRYFYKVFVCDPWQSLLANKNTVCAQYYLKSRHSTAAVAALLCVLLGAGEPGDPVCGTNPVSQVFKQACCQFCSAAVPVWPEFLWTKSRTYWQFLHFSLWRVLWARTLCLRLNISGPDQFCLLCIMKTPNFQVLCGCRPHIRPNLPLNSFALY